MSRGTALTAAVAGLLVAVSGCGGGDGASGALEAGDPGGDAPRTGAYALPQEARQSVDTLDDDQRSALATKEDLRAAEQAILDHYRADRGPEQPVPFNHQWHVSELQMSCEYCHGGGQGSEAVVMPSTSVCMGCHRIAGGDLPAIAALRTYAGQDAPVPWIRVYKVPEFVQFSHQPHLRNEIACQECHGPVEEMARIYQASDLSMGWCLECHTGEPEPGDVATDYHLARETTLPPLPEGRQSRGLYPIQIDQGYAENRAPIDCAACHY